jgi:NAD(P)-dependent dehydrogenase (short-subunit alcohol dehydrogenase family)
MNNFRANVIGVCKAVERVALPLMGLAAATYAGAEAAEIFNMSSVVGGFLGFVGGSFVWMGREAKNAPLVSEELVRSVTDRENIVRAAKEKPGSIGYFDAETGGPEGFKAYKLYKN